MRPVYKWARSVSLCVEIKSKRGAWLGLGRGRANFLRFLANRFSPGVSGCSVCAPPRWDIPAFSCRLIRYTLPPHIGEEAQRLLFRDAFFFFFFYGKSSFFFFVAVDSESLYKEMCCMIRKLIFLATIY